VISGLNHITLSVRDLAESYDFYATVLGLKPVLRWSDGAYFTAGGVWVAIVVDENAREGMPREYSHIAFSACAEEFSRLRERIIKSGAVIWQDNQSEGDSLYFSDPNGHKLELHASDLKTRVASAKAGLWPGLEIFE
jgi:catechol 2,3-dioxygenase-like lactoylglutathione lyase family enzyme